MIRQTLTIIDAVLVAGVLVLAGFHLTFQQKTLLFLLQPFLLFILSAVTVGFCMTSCPKPVVAYAGFLCLGMAFAFLGDLFMAKVIRIFPERIINGIMAFSITHACYIIAFSRMGTFFPKQALPAAVIVYIFAGVLYFKVANIPDNRILSAITFFYLIIITTMLWGSIAILFTSYPMLFKITVLAGALLFFVSDALIAYSNFRSSFASAERIIHFTYILGQMLIQISPLILIKFARG